MTARLFMTPALTCGEASRSTVALYRAAAVTAAIDNVWPSTFTGRPFLKTLFVEKSPLQKRGLPVALELFVGV